MQPQSHSLQKEIIINYDPAKIINHKKTQDHFVACMLLSALGDFQGFLGKQGRKQIQKIQKKQKKYSDATVLVKANAKALISKFNDVNGLMENIVQKYKKIDLNQKRGFGLTVKKNIKRLKQNNLKWNQTQYSQKQGGCGGSMRSQCIGLAFFRKQQISQLINVTIDSVKITHYNPIGYLGGLISAYFTALAIRRVNPKLWMFYFFSQVLNQTKQHIKYNDFTKNEKDQFDNFINGLQLYCKQQNIPCRNQKLLSQIKINFWTNYQDLSQKYQILYNFRQNFLNIQKNQKSQAGNLGFDSILIAYDGILNCKGVWKNLCQITMKHQGERHATGAIAGAWYGAFYGFPSQIQQQQYEAIEFYSEIKKLGQSIFKKYVQKQKN